MIQQHFLQQQRLNYNHDRLLERYNRLAPPKLTEFRTFGSSVLPGRNYEKYLDDIHGHDRRRNSLVAQSRAGIGSASETYRWMGDGASEILPRNVSSVMQHSRSQGLPLVHAEKFEPVQIYKHPLYGPTPAYIRPIFNGNGSNENLSDKADSDNDDDDDDDEVRSHLSIDRSSNNENKTTNKPDDEDRAPLGYISYKKWKAKYANLIPVDPLLFNIYTKRPNGSIHKYGQSLYTSPPHRRPTNLDDDDLLTPTTSEVESIRSATPQEISLPSSHRYNHLKQQRSPSVPISRPLPTIQTDNESSDDESSPPDSPVPYLSRNRTNPISSTPFPSITRPSTPPVNPITIDTTVKSTTDTSPAPLSTSIPSSNIPPAPPLPPSLAVTTATTSSSSRYETPSSLPISSPPPAPPMPASLATTLPPPAPPIPPSLAVSNSSATYQAPSISSVPPGSTTSTAGLATKAVSFAGAPSNSAAGNDTSSSSDSDDEEKQKRRRRRKRQAAGVDGDSSSDD